MLTRNDDYELRVELDDFDGNRRYVVVLKILFFVLKVCHIQDFDGNRRYVVVLKILYFVLKV